MLYNILHDNPDQSLLQRLFHIRHIDDELEDFLYPTFQRYRSSRKSFSHVSRATQRVAEAMQRNEKIMIFGDYDVDGILSSFIMYIFFRDYVGYKNISLRLPHRVHDGYGIKIHHLDEIQTTGTKLIITVDNGITAIQEAIYAKQLGIDMIITDHHKPLDQLPESYALFNPQCEDGLEFKEVCGTTVAAKFCLAVAHQL
ncbi:MAG: DHH family phosphoesterase [bacterium]|nr:DHH family phosphoesterase [bacterium]